MAIVILTIGLLGMASLTVGVIHGNKFSKDLTTATTLAQDKIEEIRNRAQQDFNEIDDEASMACPNPFENFELEVTVATVDAVPLSDMKRITVTVSWTDHAGPHDVQLQTIISR